jgi:hypothetical protein
MMIFFFKDDKESGDRNALGSMLPTRTYWDKNSLSQGIEGLLVWMETVELGDHTEERFEISLILSSNAIRRLEKACVEKSNRTIRGLPFSLKPMMILGFEERDSRSE